MSSSEQDEPEPGEELEEQKEEQKEEKAGPAPKTVMASLFQWVKYKQQIYSLSISVLNVKHINRIMF